MNDWISFVHENFCCQVCCAAVGGILKSRAFYMVISVISVISAPIRYFRLSHSSTSDFFILKIETPNVLELGSPKILFEIFYISSIKELSHFACRGGECASILK